MFMMILITPVLLLPNYESVAKISALGTGLIFVIFVAIGGYGLQAHGLEGFHTISRDDLWPHSFTAFSNWFGVVVCKFHHYSNVR